MERLCFFVYLAGLFLVSNGGSILDFYFVVNRTRVQAEQGRGTSTSSLEEALCDRAAFFESVIIIARNREKRDSNNNSILSCSRSSNQTSNLSIT